MNTRQFSLVAAGFTLGLAALASTVHAAPDYTFSTLAGSPGNRGGADGAGDAARFNDPTSLAVDVTGDVYVADTGNHTVRVITPGGIVITIAGLAGTPGNADGEDTAARFNYPDSIAVDSTGTVYVGESQLGKVRKITPDGVVTTLTGLTPYDGPYDLAVDESDRLYAAAGYDGIVQVMPTGVWVPLGISSDWSVNTLSLDAQGIFYAAVENEIDHGVLRFPSPPFGAYVWSGPVNAAHAIDPDGAIFTVYQNEVGLVIPGVTSNAPKLAGASEPGSADGVGSSARFNHPSDIAVDRAGNLYIVDRGNHTIRKGTLVPAPGRNYLFTTLAGSPQQEGSVDGVGSSARFNFPSDVAVDGSGNIFVADFHNHTVRKITKAGVVTTLAGSAGNEGRADGTGAAARFHFPASVAVDVAGNVFVIDSGNERICRITAAGVVTTVASVSQAQIWWPGLALDGSGNIFVADNGSHTIRKITPAGISTVFAGAANVSGNADGTGSAARFHSPTGITVDGSGNVFVADSGNATVRKITAAGVVTTLAGGFYSCIDVAVDGLGNVFVAEADGVFTETAMLRKITPDGTVSTLTGEFPGHADGIGAAALLYVPVGVAVDTRGTLFIADGDNTIRKGVPARAAGLEPPCRIVNASVRAQLIASQPLIAGVVTRGGALPVLLRAIGPGLRFLVPASSTLAGDPRLALFASTSAQVAFNDNWEGDLAIDATSAAVGAFPLFASGLDAALLHPLAGSNTAHVTAASDGLGLLEIYDAGPGGGGRLANISVRHPVGTGTGALIAGFVIEGEGEKTVLVRGVGPTLATPPFNISGTLADPRLEVFNSVGQRFAENDDWSSSLSSVVTQVGAFHLPATNKDAALLLTLQPGVYTAALTGIDGGTGEGLLEIYEVQ